jgi:hypothetical protein
MPNAATLSHDIVNAGGQSETATKSELANPHAPKTPINALTKSVGRSTRWEPL